MQNETYTQDPSQPEAPNIEASQANSIGNAMIQGAGDAVRAASLAREAEQAEQLARPLAPNAITEVPTSTTTPETTPPTTTTVPSRVPSTTVPRITSETTTTPPKPPIDTNPSDESSY